MPFLLRIYLNEPTQPFSLSYSSLQNSFPPTQKKYIYIYTLTLYPFSPSSRLCFFLFSYLLYPYYPFPPTQTDDLLLGSINIRIQTSFLAGDVNKGQSTCTYLYDTCTLHLYIKYTKSRNESRCRTISPRTMINSDVHS